MNCGTVEILHPLQSTRDIDGIAFDRETDADIAYDGITFAEHKVNSAQNKQRIQTSKARKQCTGESA